MRVKVLREFRDGSDFSKLYSVGDEVVIADKARVERLLTLKLVESVKNKETDAVDKPLKDTTVMAKPKKGQPNTEE